jgi:hypothetical protein
MEAIMRKPALAVLAGAALMTGVALESGVYGEAAAPGAITADHRSYAVSGFDRIGQVGPNHVVVTVGPAASVRADGPSKTLDLFEVVVERGSLEIRPKRNDRWDGRDWPWHNIEPAVYRVTLPRLAGVSTAGSGDIAVDRVDGDRFAASVAGSGTIDVRSLDVGSVHVSVAGSGDFIARGKATDSNISIAGSGDVKTREVATETASISVVSSGDAALTVRSEAHVSIMGSGDVDITGSARCAVSRFGSGSVRCGNVAVDDTRR